MPFLSNTRRAPRRAVLLAAALALLASAPADARLAIEVLSGRADLVSGGDALVEITLPPRTRARDLAALRVEVDGRDVKGAFVRQADGRLRGLVTGLLDGENHMLVRFGATGPGATLTLTGHPNGGPLIAGPQIQPWRCQATAEDAQCNQPARFDYYYVPASPLPLPLPGSFTAYDPASPPAASSVATITTDQGRSVPYMIRVETGYQDRDQYAIATLFDPANPFDAVHPANGAWNGKLVITHGASCGIDHQAGTAPDVMYDPALSRGFAVMSTALNNAGHNCNIATQAESLIMAKERVVEQLGPIRYTIGTGCSGGSLTQQQVANAYPGIYQGILPQCSFPDAWSTGQQLVDYHLVRRYVEDPTRWGTGIVWEPLSIAAVEGHPNHVNSIILDSLYLTALGDPTNACAGVTDAERYDPDSNPTGVRCTLADYSVNVLGRRAQDGFAGRPLDNVGVQYGLLAMQRGQITPAQFADLNGRIGGADIDVNYTAERTTADQPALLNAYRSGGINTGNNLDQVAIIDLRGPDPGAFHDAYRTFAVRARLEREQGHFRNHVIWFGLVPLLGDLNYAADGLVAMDAWLAGVEADTSTAPLADKIVAHRPAGLQDRCTQIPGLEAISLPGVSVVCQMPEIQTRYGTPRTVAGESIATDTNKCRLKPLVRSDYYPITFTDAQWAQLVSAFPTGVCDWSRPGESQRGAIPWLTYEDRVGGRVLGRAPRSASVPASR